MAAPHLSARTPVVLDVDTGVDDALAIMLAARHPALDLRAVTCVGGNAPVDRVVRNSLVVLDAADRPEVPVAQGAARPLLEPSRDARHVHGDDGMGDLGWPDAAARMDDRHAVELLRDLLLPLADAPEEERLTLVTLAPLTNIALLLRTWPEAAAGLRRIVMMGGTAGTGNATASAEFNVWHDPESAAVALEVAGEAGVPVTMYGLDVFYDVVVDRSRAAELAAEGRRTGNRAAELGGLLVGFQCERFGAEQATIGDAGAVCAVVDPDGLQTARLPVRVELSGTWSRGRTIVDRRDWSGDLAHDPHGLAPTSVDVALAVDGKRYADLWLGSLTAPAEGRG